MIVDERVEIPFFLFHVWLCLVELLRERPWWYNRTEQNRIELPLLWNWNCSWVLVGRRRRRIRLVLLRGWWLNQVPLNRSSNPLLPQKSPLLNRWHNQSAADTTENKEKKKKKERKRKKHVFGCGSFVGFVSRCEEFYVLLHPNRTSCCWVPNCDAQVVVSVTCADFLHVKCCLGGRVFVIRNFLT